MSVVFSAVVVILHKDKKWERKTFAQCYNIILVFEQIT